MIAYTLLGSTWLIMAAEGVRPLRCRPLVHFPNTVFLMPAPLPVLPSIAPPWR